tara:strand:+ start:34378 stop:35247 length:870 start_codon:yes stop_codon:yes gene_type:complete
MLRAHTKLRLTGTKLELSVEFFPPKTEEGMSRFVNAAKDLSKVNLNYASVTYGAGGSTKSGTMSAVDQLNGLFQSAVPHISCVGSSEKQAQSLLDQYVAKRLNHLIVLRGDLPSGFGGSGEFQYASDLVRFIRKKFDSHFRIEVAAYPETHPQAKSCRDDIENFIAKVEAGADGAITQYFYNSDAYFRFVDEVGKFGVKIPIVPGIMPITNYTQLVRFSDACGAEVPRWIKNRLAQFADDSKSIKEFGLEVVSNLCDQLVTAGVPGLHFYSMNKSNMTLEILKNVGLVK